jgi:hypothetical protein
MKKSRFTKEQITYTLRMAHRREVLTIQGTVQLTCSEISCFGGYTVEGISSAALVSDAGFAELVVRGDESSDADHDIRPFIIREVAENFYPAGLAELVSYRARAEAVFGHRVGSLKKSNCSGRDLSFPQSRFCANGVVAAAGVVRQIDVGARSAQHRSGMRPGRS